MGEILHSVVFSQAPILLLETSLWLFTIVQHLSSLTFPCSRIGETIWKVDSSKVSQPPTCKQQVFLGDFFWVTNINPGLYVHNKFT